MNIQTPSGAFYLFPDFENYRDNLANRGILDSPTFCKQLLHETGVALLPGSVFGRDATELNARLAYVNFDGGQALKISRSFSTGSMLTMEDLGDNVLNVKDGIEKLIDWLKE